MLFITPTGWALLLVGSAVGALFAAFAFAISVFAVPMLLEEQHRRADRDGHQHGDGLEQPRGDDRLGRHRARAVPRVPRTGFIGLILVFPVLGHATWHAYRAIRGDHRGEERADVHPAGVMSICFHDGLSLNGPPDVAANP